MNSEILDNYHEATQKLAASLPPHVPSTDKRHQGAKGDISEDPRLMRYSTAAGCETEEQRGVLHLVQGWIQQRQKEKVCILFEF